MPHQRFHLHHIGDVQGVVQAAATSRHREPDDPAASAELESDKGAGPSAELPRTTKGEKEKKIRKEKPLIPQHSHNRTTDSHGRRGCTPRGKWVEEEANHSADGHRHSSVLQPVSMVAQHVLGQHHAGRPELAPAPGAEILV